jgi:hypothetical protein
MWHRAKSRLRQRKQKFASDEAEIDWLKGQGIKGSSCSEYNLTPEQRRRWRELTDRPFPDYSIILK